MVDKLLIGVSMYISLLNKYAQDIDFSEVQPAATEQEVLEAENQLNLLFPDELKDFLYETNGDNFLCLSLNRIIADNLRLRKTIDTSLFDLSNFLFIATNGCGDYYGYQIENGTIQSTSIYIWDHEEFEAKLVASSISELIIGYYQNQI